jgi:hypothetical protein
MPEPAITLEMLANLSQIVGTVTLVSGAVFGLVQLAEHRRQRRDAVAADVMRTFLGPELSDAIARIRGLPDGVSAEQLRASGPETERAAVLINMSFETLGLMVYQRIAPFELVLSLAGGITVVLWRKLGPWMQQVRIEQAQPSWAEWFEWLAIQCEKRKQATPPAHVAHRDWTPGRPS